MTVRGPARAAFWALAAAFALAACQPAAKAPKPGDVSAERLTKAEASQWMSYGRTYDEQRFSPLDKINTTNVAELGLAWHADFDTDRGQQATPIVVDGTLYTTTAWSKVFAFDAKTGAAKWSYDPQVDGATGFKACCDVVNRGVAVWNGKVFVGALDGRLIALDAATGKEVWSKVTVDQSKPYTITGAPRVIKGRVIIGNGGAEYGVRGYVSAYDTETGDLVWRFYTTPNPEGKADNAASDAIMAEKGGATWFDGAWKKSGGGGTVWDAMAYDPELNTLYVGVGNGSPWNHRVRSGGKGDNLFLSSILALDADTGAYKWHYQTTPGETWDYTATQHIMLADLTIDGQPRKVLMQAPKNGFFYVLDRTDGKLISAKPYIPISWAKGVDMATGRPIEAPEMRFAKKPALVMPAPFGGHNWHPMAFNAKEGLVYIPAMAIPSAYGNVSKFGYRDGTWNTGTDFLLAALPDDEAQRQGMKAMLKGLLIAWDPVKQEARWTVEHPYFWNAGILSTAGGLVFQGAAEGKFRAYDAATGKELWSTDTTNGVIAPPSTYEINGEQYVALMVGYGGAAPLAAGAFLPDRPRLPGRLLVFKLGGKATAPAYDIPPKPPIDLAGVTSKGDAKAGFGPYMENCQVCHGPNASGAYLPDLRRSAIVKDEASFKSVVVEGSLAANGMVSFAKYLTPKQVEDVRAYILAEAKRQQQLDQAAAGAGAAKGGG